MSNQGRPGATRGDQWRRSSVRAHTLPGTTTLLEHPIRLRRCRDKGGCLLCRHKGCLIVSEFGVCPPRQAPVAPVLGTRSYASSTHQRSPMCAHARPCAPMSAHRYQRVPQGTRGPWLQWAHRGAQGRRLVWSSVAGQTRALDPT